MEIKDMQNKIASLLGEANTLTGKADFGEADNTRVEAILQEVEGIKGQMATAKKLADVNSWASQSAGMLPVAAQTQVTALGMKQSGEVVLQNRSDSVVVNYFGEPTIDPKTYAAITNPAYKSAFRDYIVRGERAMTADSLKTLTEGVDTAGGFTVPEDLLNRIIAKDPAPQTIASKVTRMNTSRDTLVIPKVRYTTDNKYTTGMAVTWTGEEPASATTHAVTDPVFGEARIPIYTAMMSCPVSNDLIEDSSVNILSWLTGKFSETADLLFENMIINGTGSNQPFGILVAPNDTDNPATVNTGVAAALSWEGIQNLAFALPEQYDRNGGFYMNKTNTALALSKLVDGDARPLWTAGAGDYGLSGDRINKPLLGYPVVYNAFMPNVGANTYPIIFGDLSGYYLVTRIGFSIQVLREIYAQTNKVLVLGRIRFGGKVVEDWRIKIQKVSA